MEPLLRTAEHIDVPKIVLCYLRSWWAAYQPDLPAETLDKEVAKRRSFDWHRGITSDESRVVVATDGEALVGVLQADIALPGPRDLPEVTMLYVDPDAWGSDVASMLLGAGLDWVTERGFAATRTRVVEEHGRARRFYEREGYVLDLDMEPARNDFGRLIYYRKALTL